MKRIKLLFQILVFHGDLVGTQCKIENEWRTQEVTDKVFTKYIKRYNANRNKSNFNVSI